MIHQSDASPVADLWGHYCQWRRDGLKNGRAEQETDSNCTPTMQADRQLDGSGVWMVLRRNRRALWDEFRSFEVDFMMFVNFANVVISTLRLKVHTNLSWIFGGPILSLTCFSLVWHQLVVSLTYSYFYRGFGFTSHIWYSPFDLLNDSSPNCVPFAWSIYFVDSPLVLLPREQVHNTIVLTFIVKFIPFIFPKFPSNCWRSGWRIRIS